MKTEAPKGGKRIGVSVTCATCGLQKQPRGRSAPMGMTMCNPKSPYNAYAGCDGYWREPLVGDLWPRETEMDWGYRFTHDGTREMTEQEIAKWEAERSA